MPVNSKRMSKPQAAKAWAKTASKKIEQYERILSLLFKLRATSADLNTFLLRSKTGIQLKELLDTEQKYVWRAVGLAEYLYPVYADHFQQEPVAFVTQDTDYVPQNSKDLRFTWRIMGRAGTDNNGWCTSLKAAKRECETYFKVDKANA